MTIGKGKYEKTRWLGQVHDSAWILTQGIFVLFALYLLSLAVYGDASRFYVLFFLAGLLTVWLERIDPHPESSRNFRRLFFCTFLFFALIHVISLLCVMDLPGLEYSKRLNHNAYGFVIALSLGMGLRDRRSIHRLFWLMLIFYGGWNIFELFSLSPEAFSVHGRFIGIRYSNPNAIAMVYVILFSVYLGYALTVREKRIAGLVLCGLGVTIWLLLLTKSRSSLLTVGFATVPVALITQKGQLDFKKRLAAACLVFFLIAPLLAFTWYSHAGKDRKSPETAIIRFQLWQDSLDMLVRPPWYRFYIGYGNIKNVNAKIADHYGIPVLANHAHNIYFQTLIETGVLGLVTLIFIFGVALFGVCREWKVNKPANGDLSPVFITAIASILFVGQMDHVLKYSSGKLVWIIIGLALAYGKMGFQENTEMKSAQGGQISAIPTRSS